MRPKRRALALVIGVAAGLAFATTATAGPDVAPGPKKHATTPHVGSDAQEACRQRAVAAVQRRYESIRDLRARFVQTTRAASVGDRASEKTTSRGSVVVAKPSRMRWSYETPEPSLVISDGKTLWIYDPAFAEAQRMPADGAFFSGAALQFLLGRGDMEKEFAIRLVSCEEKAVELELTPREPTSYEKLFLVANPGTGDVFRTRIDDLLGNSTVVEFSDLQVNLDPPADLFRFEPPANVRVIDLSQPSTR
jgi:outer membrane lipoprotein carrier protein